LLLCDNFCILPFNAPTSFLITRRDVLHCWSVPALSLKVDAIPGLSSYTVVNISQPGFYVGMCRELCGAYHSYIPINVQSVSAAQFIDWLSTLGVEGTRYTPSVPVPLPV
jgi:heme/copper-type cytochrome/quinol oxidase subunit 2